MRLAELNQNKELIDTVKNLAKFYRGVLSKGSNIIQIRDEINITENYLKILKVRYFNNLEYKIDINKELEEYVVLKLCLQPLVENAMYHGLRNKEGKGVITISGYLFEDKICLSVKDNGIGIKPEQLEDLLIKNDNFEYKNKGFGLKSTHERIKLYFGTDYGLEITSTYGEGTRVDIIFPQKKMEIFHND